MRNTVAVAAVAILSALTAASPAAADPLGTFLFGRPTQPGILAFVLGQGKNDDNTQIPTIYRYPSPEMRARAQNEIAADAAIRTYLESRNILPQNVIAIQTAASGGKIIYAR